MNRIKGRTFYDEKSGNSHEISEFKDEDGLVKKIGIAEKGNWIFGNSKRRRITVISGIIRINGRKCQSKHKPKQRFIEPGEKIRLEVQTDTAAYICEYV